MEFWRAWCIPASGPEFPQAGLLDSFETTDGEVRISIRVLNGHAPGVSHIEDKDMPGPS